MAIGGEMLVRYSDEVEAIHHGEAEISEQIAATLLDIAKKVGERQRHTVRAVHAKSHGLLKAEVTAAQPQFAMAAWAMESIWG